MQTTANYSVCNRKLYADSGRGSIRCNITEYRCKRVPGFGFVILIHHRQLMVKIFLFPNQPSEINSTL